MSRDEILELYDIEDGKIVTPGIYYGQPIYLPYFLELAKEGYWQGKNDTCYTMTLEKEDRDEFPELKEKPKHKRFFALFQQSDGTWWII